MGYYRKAIEYHHRALTIYVLSLPVEHPATSCVCEHIGDVYRLLGKKRKARYYYDEPERMAIVHKRKVEKYGLKETKEDEDMILKKESRFALLIDQNAFAYSTTE